MERITGPYKGFFIAAYTVENDTGHVGYAKVCVMEPDSVWNADPVEKFTSATGFHSELEAIVAAERKARKDIAAMLGSGHIPTDPAPLITAPPPFDRHLQPPRR